MSYCKIAPGHPLHGPYHDQEYGLPVSDESTLFERLVLEINQAGLSWTTILAKRQNFRAAYDNFVVDRVAHYGVPERTRLLNDVGIVRNRLKVDAAIENARRIRDLCLHWRRDYRGIPAQHRLPARRARENLSSLCKDIPPQTAVDDAKCAHALDCASLKRAYSEAASDFAIRRVTLTISRSCTAAIRQGQRSAVRSERARLADMANEFTAIIERDGDWYIAYCAEIPGANGQGRTKRRARV